MKSLLKKLLAPLALIAFLAGPVYAQDDPPADPASTEAADAAPVAAGSEAPADPASEENEISDAEPVASDAIAEPEAADEAKSSGALSKLASDLMGILVPAFLSLISLLVALILNWVRKRFKINVSDSQIASWSALASKGAGRAAEWGRNKAIELADGREVPGGEKMEVAVDWAVEMGRALKLPEIGREKLVGLIESHIAAKRDDPADPLPA